ncbi:MAG: LamG-like jellyroll fold domain-containing protein [Chitinophagaceae bacterium]
MYKYLLAFCMMTTAFAQAQITATLPQNGNGKNPALSPGLLSGSTVFTIEFWVRTVENRSNDIYWQRPYLFGNATNGDNSGDFGITTNNGYIGMWEGLSSINTDQFFLSQYVRINDDRWHHIAAVNNGQNINLYVDGSIAGSLVSGRALNTRNAALTFGAASLDYNMAGSTANGTNFSSQGIFKEARISGTVRYNNNFTPPENYFPDGNTTALYQFDNGSTVYSSIIKNPNKPVVVDPSQPINSNDAQPAMLYINDSVMIEGRLMIGKKDWSLSNDMLIRFYDGKSKKVQYYKPEEIRGFQMGDGYYEPKFISSRGVINTPFKKTMVKRLSPMGSKMAMYEYEAVSTTKNQYGAMETNAEIINLVGLPNTTDDKVYQFSDNKFSPRFDEKVSEIVKDNQALADKIRSKDKEYFYGFIVEKRRQLQVWWNIINEYNK